MGVYDKEWNRVVKRIIEEGYDQRPEWVYSHYRDGSPASTRYLLDESMMFADVENALPIPQNKFIDVLKPLREMELFWKLKSNRIDDLRAMGTHIWDDWEIKEGFWAGTIGPSYGFVLGVRCRKYPVDKLNWDLLDQSKIEEHEKAIFKENGTLYIMLDQVDHTMQELKNNPGSRYHQTSLWDTRYLDQMALKPCVWSTRWSLTPDYKLNLRLTIRSNDMGLGNAYNMYQYAVLLSQWAQVLGYEVGFLKADPADAHLYHAHIETAKKQLEVKTDLPEARLELNPKVKNFYEFDMDKDVKVLNLDPDVPVFKYPIAIS